MKIEDTNLLVDGNTCTTCGKCCVSNHCRWVPLLPSDAIDIECNVPNGADLIAPGDRYYVGFMRMVEGRCVALKRTAHGLLQCSIYEYRPKACRDYDAGDYGREHLCLEVRAKTANVLQRWKDG